MQLLGIEFKDFAVFDRQFVPVEKGVNLLVGKNNSGKTALLQAIRNCANLPANVGGDFFASYLRHGSSHVEISIIFGIEAEDRPILSQGQQWPPPMDSAPFASFRFLVGGWGLTFEDATVYWDLGAIKFLEANESGVSRLQYSYSGNTLSSDVKGRGFITTGIPVGTPKGTRHLINGRPTGFDVFSTFSNVEYIDAHRVASNAQPLQTDLVLQANASNLASYLSTLQSNDRERFQAIESFIVDAFPEFKSLEIPSENNTVQIKFKLKTGGLVPIHRTGTGVEQMLAIVSLLEDVSEDGIVLVDEPHSFLHPAAERKLVELLERHVGKRVLVTTHSPVLINAFPSNRITYLRAPGVGFREKQEVEEPSSMLYELGYRNSDFLLDDQLIFGEGATEPLVLPVLLRNAGVPESRLRSTGFLELRGFPESADAQQKEILKIERILQQFKKTSTPRLYLLDGDRNKSDGERLLQTADITGSPINIKFLPKMEIENYFLVPDALATVINNEIEAKGLNLSVTPEMISRDIDELLAETSDERLFPGGSSFSRKHDSVKGGEVLKRVFRGRGELRYDKKRTGLALAKLLTKENQPDLAQLAQLFESLQKDNPGTSKSA